MVQRALSLWPGAYVIAADGGAISAVECGIQPHLIIGDMDSVDPELLENLQTQGAETQRYPVEKDETDLQLALLAAAERDARKILVLGALGGRLDHKWRYAIACAAERRWRRCRNREFILSAAR